MSKKLYLVCMICLFCSCEKEVKNSENTINIDLTENVKVDSESDYKYSDFFKSFECFQIPHESINIGRISRISQIKNQIYILDKNSKSIYCFNIDGELEFKINSIGKGPGEFTILGDMLVSREQIFIYAPAQKKIIKFSSYDGKFISERKMNFRFRSFECTDKYTYYLMQPENEIKHWLYIENNKTRQIEKALPICNYPSFEIGLFERPFFRNKDTVILCHSYIETMFKIHDNKVEPYINLNTGMSSFYKKLESGFSNKDIRYKIKYNQDVQRSSISMFHNYFENNTFIYFLYHDGSDKKFKHVIYNKLKKNSRIQQNFKNDILQVNNILYSTDSERNSVSFINSDQTYWIKKRGINEERNVSKNKIDLTNIHIDSNPIIIRYHEK